MNPADLSEEDPSTYKLLLLCENPKKQTQQGSLIRCAVGFKVDAMILVGLLFL